MLRHGEVCWVQGIERHTKWRLLGSGLRGEELREYLLEGVPLMLALHSEDTKRVLPNII